MHANDVTTQSHEGYGLFDIGSPEDLFSIISDCASDYFSKKAKKTPSVLFLIFGLVHLREWIAPGYDHRMNAIKPEEIFFNAIYKLDAFRDLIALCNRTKHLASLDRPDGITYGVTVDEWFEIDAVRSVDSGPPSGYFLNEINVDKLLVEVINFYRSNWFCR